MSVNALPAGAHMTLNHPMLRRHELGRYLIDGKNPGHYRFRTQKHKFGSGLKAPPLLI